MKCRSIFGAGFATLLAIAAVACGDDDNGEQTVTPTEATPTSLATVVDETAMPEPTPFPDPMKEGEHGMPDPNPVAPPPD